jgi:hypothetical protein
MKFQQLARLPPNRTVPFVAGIRIRGGIATLCDTTSTLGCMRGVVEALHVVGVAESLTTAFPAIRRDTLTLALTTGSHTHALYGLLYESGFTEFLSSTLESSQLTFAPCSYRRHAERLSR